MDRKKALQEYVKMVEEGRPFSEDFIGKTRDVEDDALRARTFSGDALADQVLKNTGVPIPDKTAPIGKQEDFLNRIVNEQYPEIKDPKIQLGLEDSYDPSTGGILVRKRPDVTGMVSKAFHEGAHKYDKDVLDHTGKNLDLGTLRNLQKRGMDLKSMDPTTVYELYAQQHHAALPEFRGGNTFELGALKNYLKKGTFRGIAPTLAKGAAIGAGGLASLASEAADTEETGEAPEQAAMLRESDEFNRRKQALQNEEMRPALEKMYEEADQGKMFDARRDALQALKRR